MFRHRSSSLAPIFTRIIVLFTGLAFLSGLLATRASLQGGNSNRAVNTVANKAKDPVAPPTPIPTTTVKGRAVYEDSGKPIRRAVVMLFDIDRMQQKAAITDDNGNFEIPGVWLRNYIAVVDSPGAINPLSFIDFSKSEDEDFDEILAAELKRHTQIFGITDKDGQEILVKAKRGSSISGRVLFKNGDPAPGTLVQILRKFDTGYSQLIGSMYLTAKYYHNLLNYSDDAGYYHFDGLPPGEYVVRTVEYAEHGTDRKSALYSIAKSLFSSYAVSYYPTAESVDAAGRIQVAKGRDIQNADITVNENHSYQLNGIVRSKVTGKPIKGMTVMLFRNDNTFSISELQSKEDSEVATLTDENGAWKFTGLSKGNYRIQARPNYYRYYYYYRNDFYSDRLGGLFRNPVREGFAANSAAFGANAAANAANTAANIASNAAYPYRDPAVQRYNQAERLVSLTDARSMAVNLDLAYASKISGRIVFEGPVQKYYYYRIVAMDEKQAVRDSVRGGNDSYPRTRSKSSPSFSFGLGDVPSTKIFLDASESYGYYVKSVTVGGKDIISGFLDITDGSEIKEAEIRMAPMVKNIKPKFEGPYKVSNIGRLVLIPLDETKRRYASWENDVYGSDNLMSPPGEFYVFVSNSYYIDWAKLQRLIKRGGRDFVKVTIKSVPSQTITINTSNKNLFVD